MFSRSAFRQRSACGPKAALGGAALAALLPFYFGMGMLMMPDAPLLACWAGALFYLYRALIEERRWAWAGAGLFMGLGLITKYTIVLLGGAALLFVLADGPSRKWLRRPEPYLSVILALIIFTPVIVWNAQHDWASFVYQTEGRIVRNFDFDLPDMIAMVILLLTPAGFMAAASIVASGGAVLPGEMNSRGRRVYRMFLSLSLLPLSVFVFYSLFRNVKLNWTGPIWLGLLPYIAALFLPGQGGQTGRLRRFLPQAWMWTVPALLLLYGAGLHYLVLGFPGVPYPKNSLGIGVEDLARQVDVIVGAFEKETGETPLTVCMYEDRMPGWIAF